MELKTRPALPPLAPGVQTIFTAAADTVVPSSAAEKAICDLLIFAEIEHRKISTHAARDVLFERSRQVAEEGWTLDHDDKHDQGEMAWAAACYALIGRQHHPAAAVCTGDQIAHEAWPWALQWFKPTERRRDLVKAAALLLAEIERLDRMAAVDVAAHKCFICDKPFVAGEMVLPDFNEGLGHRTCFGEDRGGYVKDIDSGEPLDPADPIPAGEPYRPEDWC